MIERCFLSEFNLYIYKVMKSKFLLPIILIISVFLAFFVFPSAWNRGADFVNAKVIDGLKLPSGFKIPHFFSVPDFHLGLDLLGGTHLVYQADLSGNKDQNVSDAMNGVRDVIERRVNAFGVAEPLVQIEGNDRLVVELAGISDVNQAIQLIGETPFLEFKEQRTQAETQAILEAQAKGQRLGEDPYFSSTALTGKNLDKATLIFDQTTSIPQVALDLDTEGAKLFEDITKRNLNKIVAIYVDGIPVTTPIVQSVITNGKAVISSPAFTLQAAKALTNSLNAGALPVPITLISQQTVGASLGHDSLNRSLTAALYGFLLVAIFMILYYRLPGVVSVVALLIYTAIVLAIYKVIPVTLSLAGIAGFILSLGMAVDANILIFARMREELKAGKSLSSAVNEGFNRAWLSIRDSHVTGLLGAIILYMFTTSIVKGFALTLGIGVLVSLLTATIVTRSMLNLFVGPRFEKKKWLF